MILPFLTLAFVLGFVLVSPARADAISALKAADAGQWQTAQREAGRSIAGDIVLWMYLLDDKTTASFQQIATFLNAHPDWPEADKLFRVAEKRLPDDLSNAQLINWFAKNQPVTGAGMQRYMNALLQGRQTSKALTTLKSWWVDAKLSTEEQDSILSSYGKYLGTADHARRLDNVIEDKRYKAARSLAARMGNGYPQLVEARVALQEGGDGIQGRVNSVSGVLQNDSGLMLARLQYRRKKDLDAGAIEILNAAPPAMKTSNPSGWWKERHIMVRRMMEQRRYHDAYKLAKAHGTAPGTGDFAQAEFVAGWLALRRIKQPYAAFEHFEKLFNNVKTPISRARGSYWAARASEALGHKDVAMKWYQNAAGHQTTFYGQMAAERIGLPLNLLQTSKPMVTPQQKAAFRSRDVVQAATLLHRAGLSDERTQFLKAMLNNAETPQDYTLISDFAVSLGQVDMAMKIAKKAERVGVYLIDYLFPTIMHTVGNHGADYALVHALIRQESQFDQRAKSPSGALGLMQIMPTTGTYTAKKNGLAHNTSWLVARPEHNVRIGSIYINEMLNRYDGSLPMAIAAYNAGPGRVDGWIKEFGDPRTSQIDMMDWMETIPIYETRNYVQRVLEGYKVYRTKIGAQRSGTPLRTVYNK